MKKMFITIRRNDFAWMNGNYNTFFSVKWKNPRPPPHLPYSPTPLEHAANIITHGVSQTDFFFLSILVRLLRIRALSPCIMHTPKLRHMWTLSLSFFDIFFLDFNNFDILHIFSFTCVEFCFNFFCYQVLIVPSYFLSMSLIDSAANKAEFWAALVYGLVLTGSDSP